ncbi:hypothetical protein LP417_10740 [Polaromonas sp. P1-6]|nr:hypothetical protein LP417_10740 [Polaromonas sp. P1-6]
MQPDVAAARSAKKKSRANKPLWYGLALAGQTREGGYSARKIDKNSDNPSILISIKCHLSFFTDFREEFPLIIDFGN